MAKGEFDMLYLCAGGGGGQKKTPEIIRGGFKKMKGKNKEIIIAHPLYKLWMLPYSLLRMHQYKNTSLKSYKTLKYLAI